MPRPGDEERVIVLDPRPAPAAPDLADAVAQAVRVGFGLLSVGLGVALRTVGEPAAADAHPGARVPLVEVADLVVGTAWGAARLSGRLAAAGSRVAVPLIDLALRPPLVPPVLQPGHTAQLLIDREMRLTLS